jgi:sulfite dehydrogenase (cytochrome) subunit B
MRNDMRNVLVAAATFAAVFGISLATTPLAKSDTAGAAVTITLPPDARSFGPGPGQSIAQANCTVCHAADYVYMQPPMTADQWRAEVMKMQKAYGATIDASVVDALVQYLVAQNGKQ